MFKNKYGEFRSGWAVTVSMIIFFIALFVISVILNLLISLVFISLNDAVAYPISNILNQGLFFLIAFLVFKMLYRRPISQTGLSREKWLLNFLIGILFGFIIFSAVVGALIIAGVLKFNGINPDFYRQVGFYVAISTFSAGFGEEMMCRGLLTFQMKTTRSKLAILTVPSLIFSLLHLMNPGVTVLSLVNIIVVGILFGVMLMRTGSLWICIGAHGMWNLAQGAIFGIKVSGNEVAGIFTSELSGSPLLAGGEFGAEGSIICTVVLVIATGLSFVIFKKPIDNGFSVDGHLPLTKYSK